MAAKHEPLVKELATNKPTAVQTFSLTGSGVTNFRSFASAYTNGDVIPVFAHNADNSLWEESECTLSTGVLTRTTILKSSNSNNAVDFSGSATDITLSVSWQSSIASILADPGAVIVRGSLTGQAVSNATFTKVTTALGNAEKNNRGWWSDANKRFTPAKPGTYYVAIGIMFQIVPDSASVIPIVSKNGSDFLFVARGYMSKYSGIMGCSGSCLIPLNGSTDYVEFFVYQDSGATLDTPVAADIYRTFFHAFRVGD